MNEISIENASMEQLIKLQAKYLTTFEKGGMGLEDYENYEKRIINAMKKLCAFDVPAAWTVREA